MNKRDLLKTNLFYNRDVCEILADINNSRKMVALDIV